MLLGTLVSPFCHSLILLAPPPLLDRPWEEGLGVIVPEQELNILEPRGQLLQQYLPVKKQACCLDTHRTVYLFFRQENRMQDFKL